MPRWRSWETAIRRSVGDSPPVGFRLPRLSARDLQLAIPAAAARRLRGRRGRLAKLSPQELARLKGRIQLQDGSDLSQSTNSSIDNGPTNHAFQRHVPPAPSGRSRNSRRCSEGEFTDAGYSREVTIFRFPLPDTSSNGGTSLLSRAGYSTSERSPWRRGNPYDYVLSRSGTQLHAL